MTRFWEPEFDYDRRADGTVLMRQTKELPDHLRLLAEYLEHWAGAAPDRPWLARRGPGGDWITLTYREGLARARAIGGALLALGLGPDRPLLILSGNSLEHALLGAACFLTGIPYAPVSPAYSLVSQDHAKLKEIVATLNPGAFYVDDARAFGPALRAVGADRVIALVPAADEIPYQSLLQGDTDLADQARARLTPDAVVKYLFTSGSTGSPKAVINTNAMICAM